MAAVTRPLTVAPVGGWSAFVLSRLLAEHVAKPTSGTVHPELVDELHTTLAALRQAADDWVRWRRACSEIEAEAAVDASIAAAEAAAARASVEVDTTTAATWLQVTPNRVRQLCRAEVLPGRKTGRTWLVSTDALEMFAEGRYGRI